MLTDFRKAPAVISDLFIDGVKVERVTEYRYLGTVLDNKLNLKTKQKTNKLRSLNVSAAVLLTFYLTCIESVLTFLFPCSCEKQKCPEQSGECVWQGRW